MPWANQTGLTRMLPMVSNRLRGVCARPTNMTVSRGLATSSPVLTASIICPPGIPCACVADARLYSKPLRARRSGA
eukprot:14402432-Heterocapsa_arctica.AAC.1